MLYFLIMAPIFGVMGIFLIRVSQCTYDVIDAVSADVYDVGRFGAAPTPDATPDPSTESFNGERRRRTWHA